MLPLLSGGKDLNTFVFLLNCEVYLENRILDKKKESKDIKTKKAILEALEDKPRFPLGSLIGVFLTGGIIEIIQYFRRKKNSLK